MAAFERIQSGIPEMDQALAESEPHHRNWVSRWRLRTSADFRRFLRWRTVRWDICRS